MAVVNGRAWRVIQASLVVSVILYNLISAIFTDVHIYLFKWFIVILRELYLLFLLLWLFFRGAKELLLFLECNLDILFLGGMRLLSDWSIHIREVLDCHIWCYWLLFFLINLSAHFKFIWNLNTLRIFFDLLIITLFKEQRVYWLSTHLLLWVVNAVWVTASHHRVNRRKWHRHVEPFHIFGVPWVLEQMNVERAFRAPPNSIWWFYTLIFRPSGVWALRWVLNIPQWYSILIYVVRRWLVPTTVLVRWDVSICVNRSDTYWSNVNWGVLFVFD